MCQECWVLRRRRHLVIMSLSERTGQAAKGFSPASLLRLEIWRRFSAMIALLGTRKLRFPRAEYLPQKAGAGAEV